MSVMLVLIPAFPLAAALACALGGRRWRQASYWPAVIGAAGAFACSLVVLCVALARSGTDSPPLELAEKPKTGSDPIEARLWNWVGVPPVPDSGDDRASAPGAQVLAIDIVLRADTLTILMLVTVTLVSLLVVVYSVGYMHGDRGYWRFFAYVSLFIFSMTMLVLVSNFLLLYIFWEGVGVCSYLLIGFWYQRPAAAAAGKKAFLVNRVGDFGFALAIFLIAIAYGTLDFHDSFHNSTAHPGVMGQQRLSGQVQFVGGPMGMAICLLLMLGACGKSAQFPLHVWLPDAMEGPTPVSALIHAATMVTAGVYLVARCTPLFLASPDAQLVVASIGAFTALLAGAIAMSQFDLKRVLAYSTISQLGYMFLGLGTGSLAGITAGMFHLFTHAFFKALLFLGAGSVMHAMGDVIDMRRFAGLRHRLPITHRTFLVGCLALAGVVPFAGFWSKDAILASVHQRASPDATQAPAHGEHLAAIGGALPHRDVSAVPSANHGMSVWAVLYWTAVGSAFLTALYTFRAFFMTFYGDERIPPEAEHSAHECPRVMWIPLVILAAFAFAVGMVVQAGMLGGFLARSPMLAMAATEHAGEHGFHWQIAVLSTVVALAGMGLAAFFYLGSRGEVERVGRWLGPLYRLSERRFYWDEIYTGLVVWPLRGLARLSYTVDQRLIDALVDLCGRVPVWIGNWVRGLGHGLVPVYALGMLVGLLILVAAQWLW